MTGHSYLAGIPAFLTLLMISPTVFSADHDPFSGENLYQDVRHYSRLGHHQMGTDVDHETSNWLEQRLKQLGFSTRIQKWTSRQFFPKDTYVKINGLKKIAAFPVWWPKSTDSKGIVAALSDDLNTVQGKIYLYKNVTGPGFSVDQSLVQQIDQAAEKGAKAIILATYYSRKDTFASDEFIGLNAMQKSKGEWPIPAIMVKAKEFSILEATMTNETEVQLVSTGTYDEAAVGLNVIGSLNRTSDDNTIIVSTPSSGWFTCAGERGSGIGVWLALAHWAAKSSKNTNWMFIATSGHELRGLGTEHFLKSDLVPPPKNTDLWVHIGAWQAMYNYIPANGKLTRTNKMDNKIIQFAGSTLSKLINKKFGGPELKVRIIPRIVFGDLTQVIQHGYKNVAGISYGHEYHHSTQDLPEVTGPELLEPIARAYQGFFQDFITERN